MTHLFDTPAKHAREKFSLINFIETGCEVGEGLRLAKEYGFINLFSCDIRKEATDLVALEFPEATLITDDSLAYLKQILPTLVGPSLFWLDAHFPALYHTEEASETRWPLLQELELIKALKQDISKDVIICDDTRVIRDVNNPRYWPGEVDGYYVDADWKALWETFSETHTAYTHNVDTGILFFVPKEV